jgi:hypothetical protein
MGSTDDERTKIKATTISMSMFLSLVSFLKTGNTTMKEHINGNFNAADGHSAYPMI